MAGLLGTISGQVRLDISQAVAAYAALRAQNARTVYALRGTGDSFILAGQTMTVAGAAMVYAFAKVVQAAAEFERKMDFFAAVTNTSGKEMRRLSQFTLDLAETTIYSADQIAEGFIELGKAGVSASQIIRGIGEAMANLGAAGDIPLAESGQIITSTIQQFDLAARDAVEVTDLLAGAANASIADITDIGVSLKYVGGVANAAGLSFEDTATAISLLARAGIRGSTAGTSLRQMIVSLPGATGPARESLTKLGIITEDGTNKFYDQQGTLKPLAKVYQILQDHTANLTQKQKLMHLRTIFNNRALSAAAILTRDGAKGFREMNKEMAKTTAADVAAERLDNLSGDIEILKGNIQTLMIEAGSPFQEMLRGWVQAITRLVQKFGELDPSVQKFIVGGVAISGVALVVMGAFLIIIGVIARFFAAMLKLGAGFKFIVRWGGKLAKVLWAAFRALTPMGRAIGIVFALGGAIQQLYQRSDKFRAAVDRVGQSFMQDFVNPIVAGVQRVSRWFKTLATSPNQAWAELKSGASQAADSMVSSFQSVRSRVSSSLSSVGASTKSFVSSTISSWAGMGSRVIASVQGWISRVASLFTFRNIGYAMGYLQGMVVRQFITLGTRSVAAVGNFISRVISFFLTLPGKIGYALGFMVGRAIRFFIIMGARMTALTVRAVTSVVKFFASLPGRVSNFINNMLSRAVSLFNTLRNDLPNLAAQAVVGVVNFIRELPGKVAGFIVSMVSRARAGFQRFVSSAVSFAGGAYRGFMDALRGLPGAVSGIVGQLISAFKSKIREAANAVREFARGMWEGFKNGLGIGSPSHLERAMWRITGTLGKESQKLARQTIKVRKLSEEFGKISFNVGDTYASSSASKYARLARDQSRNLHRSRTLAAASSRLPRARSIIDQRGARSRLVSGELDLSASGRAFIRGIAQDAIDDDHDFDDLRGGMG